MHTNVQTRAREDAICEVLFRIATACTAVTASSVWRQSVVMVTASRWVIINALRHCVTFELSIIVDEIYAVTEAVC